jgi:hypothetical protein
MANAGRHDLYQDFASLGTFKVKLDNLKWLLRFKGNCCAGLHVNRVS